VPIVVTGFEPVDILEGILMVARQLEDGRHQVENQYKRVVQRQGNRPAREMVEKVFEVTDRKWRGIGEIPSSGLKIRKELAAFDAAVKFAVAGVDIPEPEICISGAVLQGLSKPHGCPAFGRECVPEHPLGAPMVSSEGPCAAYYKYHRKG
jgi:hydrogenase expression/formation protein HypD